MAMNPRLLRPIAKLTDLVSLWFAETFPTYWHWSE